MGRDMARTLKRWGGGGLAVVVAALSLVISAPSPAEALDIPEGHGAVIAIVIDDVLDNRKLDAFLELDAAITYAVFPFSRGGAHASERIREAGGEVIVHLPVTSRRSRTSGRKLGPGWPAAAVEAFVERALASVPGAVGMNNHKGSTTNVRSMRRLMAALKERDLFFLDSVTVENTVGYAAALEAGMPSRINNIFIDGQGSVLSARRSLVRLARMAAAAGSAIGIGHLQRPSTAAVLREFIPLLKAKGYVILPLSQVTSVPNHWTRNVPRTLPK